MERRRRQTAFSQSADHTLQKRAKVEQKDGMELNGIMNGNPQDKDEEENGVGHKKTYQSDLFANQEYFKKLAREEEKEHSRLHRSGAGFCHVCQKRVHYLHQHWKERHACFKNVIQCLEPSCSRLLSYRKSDLFRHMEIIHGWKKARSADVFARRGKHFVIPRHLWIGRGQVRFMPVIEQIDGVTCIHTDDDVVISEDDSSDCFLSSEAAQEDTQQAPENSTSKSLDGNNAVNMMPAVDSGISDNPEIFESTELSLDLESILEPHLDEMQLFGDSQFQLEESQPLLNEFLSPIDESEPQSVTSHIVPNELQPCPWEAEPLIETSDFQAGAMLMKVQSESAVGMAQMTNLDEEVELLSHCSLMQTLITNNLASEMRQDALADLHGAISAIMIDDCQMEGICCIMVKCGSTSKH